MKEINTLVLFFSCVIVLCTACAEKGSVITTGTLFEEMIDLVALTRYPDPTYRMVQFSYQLCSCGR